MDMITRELIELQKYRDLAPLEQVQEWAKADKAGLLVKLPCALGEKVYILSGNPFDKNEKESVVEDTFNLLFLTSYGKTVFLIREEAENALKAQEDK